MKLQNITEWLNESKQMDGILINKEIAIFVDDTCPMMYEEKLYIYFISDEIWYDNIAEESFDMLKCPLSSSGEYIIDDIWKPTNLEKYEGAEYVIGMIESLKDDTYGTIMIDLMSVRPEYRNKGINSKMLNAIRKQFKDYDITFSEFLTDDGKQFVDKYNQLK